MCKLLNLIQTPNTGDSSESCKTQLVPCLFQCAHYLSNLPGSIRDTHLCVDFRFAQFCTVYTGLPPDGERSSGCGCVRGRGRATAAASASAATQPGLGPPAPARAPLVPQLPSPAPSPAVQGLGFRGQNSLQGSVGLRVYISEASAVIGSESCSA